MQQQTYLKGVVGLDDDTVMELTNNLFIQGYKDKLKQFSQAIKAECKQSGGCKDTWITCDKYWNGCSFDLAKELINHEIGSTAYMLKVFSASVFVVGKVQKPPQPPLLFTMTGKSFELTGRWQDDAKFFRFNLGQKEGGRLVMGFGPSASGKTHLAKMILGILMTEPTCFLSIDGGIYRECCSAYQSIKGEAIKRGFRGFDNLVSTTKLKKSIFDSEIVKESVCSYLKTQTCKYNLYVPETMANPLSGDKKMKQYINLTGDADYIALLIYQHRTGAECPFKPEFKCRGCVESGTSRQETQGKKYSDGAYGMSMANGIRYMCGGGVRLDIHNPGVRDRKIIIRDFSETKDTIKFQNIPENIVYLSSETPLTDYLDKPPRRAQKIIKCQERFLSLPNPFGF